MADYIQPDYVEKRLRYFDGQLLKDQDFVDEQKYFIDRQRRHNRFLNVSGIIHGLTLTPATDVVTVAPGAALDNSGRLVVLSDQVIDKDRQAQLGAYRDTTVDLVISYKEDPDPPIGEAPRFREKPQLTVVSSGSRPDGAIALARLTIDQNGGVTVDTKVRVYAGVRVPYDGGGPELRAGSVGRLDVTGDLSVSGKVGIGATADPVEMLQVKGGNLQLDGDQQLKFTDTDLSGKLLKVQLWSGYGLGLNADTLFYASGKHSWRDVNGATERMALTTGEDGGLTVLGTGTSSFAGNVGIGTRDPGDFRLKVEGNTSLGGALTIAADKELVFTDNGQIRSLDNAHQILFRRSENILELREFGDIVFSPGATAGNATGKVVLLGNGNVGIGGTQNPVAKLVVNLATGEPWETVNKTGFRLISPDPDYYLDVTTMVVASGNVGYQFRPNGQEGLVITTPGNVGIGTTNPGTDRLKVEGTLSVSGASTLTGNTSVGGTLSFVGNASAQEIIKNKARVTLHTDGDVSIGEVLDRRPAKLNVDGSISERLEVIAVENRGDWNSLNHPVMIYFGKRLAGKPKGTMMRAITDYSGWKGHYWQGWVDADGNVRVINNYHNTGAIAPLPND